MGAEQSKGQEQQSMEDLLKKYDQGKKINHPSFGEIQILEEKTTHQQVGMREFNLTDENEFTNTIEKFKPKAALDNMNLIRLEHVIQHKESQFCSTFFKVYLVFEYIENTLEQEVLKRSEDDNKLFFSEEELWSIMDSSIQGVYYLYQNKLTHNNIRPSTIYITAQGNVKLADPTLFSQQGLYPTALTNLNSVPSGIYISPELLNDMYQQQYSPVYNQQKSDVFSLGMCLLHAATLEPLDSCYDYKSYTINEGLIYEKLNIVRMNYGDNLYQFLYLMLNFNSEERQDLSYFYQYMPSQQQYSDTATFQQQDPNFAAQQQPFATKQVEYTSVQTQQKSPERPQYEVYSTKTTTTTTTVKQEDDKVKRAAANPHLGQPQTTVVVKQQAQPQVILQQISNQPGGYSSTGMFKDSEDKGSTITFIPKDQTSKNAIPDENIGNAIGGGDTYYQQQNEVVGQTGFTTNNYTLPQTNTYVTQTYTPQEPAVQKYTPTTTTSYTTPGITSSYGVSGVTPYTPMTQFSNTTTSVPVSSTQKYSSSFVPTNAYELSRTTEVPASSNIGTGYYVSTKEQYQPLTSVNSQTSNQYTSELSKPYTTTTSYGIKENNFSYIPGPTGTSVGTGAIGTSTATTTPAITTTYTPLLISNTTTTTPVVTSTLPATTNVTSTLPLGTGTYTSSNIYTSPALGGTGTSSILKKDDSIEEAIKRSAPPPLKNDILSSSPYSAPVAQSSGSNFYTPSITTTQVQPATSTVITTTTTGINNYPVNTTTTTTTNNGAQDAYKPSDEIEAILSKYRNQKDTMTALGLTTNSTDIKLSNNFDAPPTQTYVNPTTTTTTYTSQVTPSYQAYVPSSNTYSSALTNPISVPTTTTENKPIEGLQSQFGGLNINSNPANFQISQIQSTYTANFNPSSISSTYQPSSTGVSSIQNAPTYSQNYSNIQQSFGQSKPYSEYDTTGINYVSEKEYVIENYSNNSKYEGEKYNGMRHGRGKFYYQDGGLFDGEWRENKMHGRGILSYASGKPAYDGDWVDDKFEGFGILYNENPAPLNQPYDFLDFDNVEEYWTKYEGQFKDDNKEGYGTLYLSNGEKFVGTFYKDFVNGQGTFYTLNDEIVQGSWHQNKFVSQ